MQLEKKKTYNWKIISFRREPSCKGHCSRFEFTWQGRVHTVAHCGLRRFMAPLFGRSVSPVDPTCTCRCRQTCARFFFYSCFSICHKRRGKSFVEIAYLSTSLLYLLVTQGNEHFWSFRLCEEAFNWWEVVRIIEGPPNSLVGVDFLLILFWSMRVCRLPIRLSWSSWYFVILSVDCSSILVLDRFCLLLTVFKTEGSE